MVERLIIYLGIVCGHSCFVILPTGWLSVGRERGVSVRLEVRLGIGSHSPFVFRREVHDVEGWTQRNRRGSLVGNATTTGTQSPRLGATYKERVQMTQVLAWPAELQKQIGG